MDFHHDVNIKAISVRMIQWQKTNSAYKLISTSKAIGAQNLVLPHYNLHQCIAMPYNNKATQQQLSYLAPKLSYEMSQACTTHQLC
jgi:hypothetical protein